MKPHTMKPNTKTRYASTGFKSVEADTMRDAAEIFALRAARRWYGKRACVGALNDGVRYVDGRAGEFDAFIGRPSGRNELTGHNIHFIVSVLLPAGVRAIRTGEAAIRLAETTGAQLYCYANPVDDGGPVTLDQAREIVREDSSLVYAHEIYRPTPWKSPTSSTPKRGTVSKLCRRNAFALSWTKTAITMSGRQISPKPTNGGWHETY